jgi:hypothetical protein
MKTILPVLIGLIAFFTRVVCAGTGTVTFDFNTTVRYGSPFVFGGCKYPDKAQQDDFYPKLKESGITFLRADFYFQLIIPTNKCASVADYKNNVNGIQNPDKWEYGHLFWIDSSRKYGFKTFIVTVYTPPWLSCSGNYKGVPKDWPIWEDIVKKVYSRYKMRVDWVETWNEVEYWCDLTGSPYTNKEDFLADHFYHTVKAIREAGGTIPTGGFAFAEDHTEMFKSVLQKLVAKYGRVWTEANFNFYSVHHYGSEPGTMNWRDIWGAFQAAGLSPNKGVFVDEWNYTTDWGRRPGELYNAKAIGYVGKSLASFIKNGVNAAYYSMYPSDTPVQDMDGGITLHAFYTTNGNTTPLPQSYPFKILSNRLGLGKGAFLVKAVSNQKVVDACCAVNSDGQNVAFIANYSDSPTAVNVTFKGLSGSQVRLTDYYANTWDPNCNAYQTTTNVVIKGQFSYVNNMPANTCVGLVLSPVATETPAGQN